MKRLKKNNLLRNSIRVNHPGKGFRKLIWVDQRMTNTLKQSIKLIKRLFWEARTPSKTYKLDQTICLVRSSKSNQMVLTKSLAIMTTKTSKCNIISTFSCLPFFNSSSSSKDNRFWIRIKILLIKIWKINSNRWF